MARSRRGQAAHEFVTTYGWSVLLVLAFLGVMAYFAGAHPDALRPARCRFDGGFDCLWASASQGGTLALRLESRGTATLTAAACRFEDGSATVTTRDVTADAQPLPAAGLPWAGDSIKEVACAFDADNPFAAHAGKKVPVIVLLSYTDASGAAQQAAGDVLVLVGGS